MPLTTWVAVGVSFKAWIAGGGQCGQRSSWHRDPLILGLWSWILIVNFACWNRSVLHGALIKWGCKLNELASPGSGPMTRSKWLRRPGNVCQWLIPLLNGFIFWLNTFEKSGYWLSWAARAQIEAIWIAGRIRDAMVLFLLSPINFRYPIIEWLYCDALWSCSGTRKKSFWWTVAAASPNSANGSKNVQVIGASPRSSNTGEQDSGG